MSTSVLKALPGKLDIKRHSPSILYISASLAMSTSVLKALPGKLDIKRHSPSILYVSQFYNCDEHLKTNTKLMIVSNKLNCMSEQTIMLQAYIEDLT